MTAPLQVGDRVRVVRQDLARCGQCGVVVTMDDDPILPIEINLDRGPQSWWANPRELERLPDAQMDRPRTGPDDPAADGGLAALATAQPASQAAARPSAGAPVAAPDRETGPDDRGGDAPVPGGAATAGDRAVAVAHWDEDDERALREELGLLDLEDQLDALFARADAEGVDPGDLTGIDEVPW